MEKIIMIIGFIIYFTILAIVLLPIKYGPKKLNYKDEAIAYDRKNQLYVIKRVFDNGKVEIFKK